MSPKVNPKSRSGKFNPSIARSEFLPIPNLKMIIDSFRMPSILLKN